MTLRDPTRNGSGGSTSDRFAIFAWSIIGDPSIIIRIVTRLRVSFAVRDIEQHLGLSSGLDRDPIRRLRVIKTEDGFRNYIRYDCGNFTVLRSLYTEILQLIVRNGILIVPPPTAPSGNILLHHIRARDC